MSEEEQIFYTEVDDETDKQILQRKKEARDHPANQLPDISFEKFTTHKSEYHKLCTFQKLSHKDSVAVEQNNDVILQQLLLKILKKTTQRPSFCKITATNITVAKWTDFPSLMKLFQTVF